MGGVRSSGKCGGRVHDVKQDLGRSAVGGELQLPGKTPARVGWVGSKQNRREKNEKLKKRVREFSNTIKYNNIHVTGILEGEENVMIYSKC